MIDNLMYGRINDVIKKIFISGVKFSKTLTPGLTADGCWSHWSPGPGGTVDGGERCAKRSV